MSEHSRNLVEWPKKLSAAGYRDRWYVDRTKESVINDIKRGNLPGGQEPSGQWFVWVNADMSPAHGHQGPAAKPAGTGNALADAILRRRAS